MTAALEGGEWSAARPGRTLPPGKTRYPLYRRPGEPQGRSGRAENLVPTGIRSPDCPARSSVAIPTELPGPRHNSVAEFKKCARPKIPEFYAARAQPQMFTSNIFPVHYGKPDFLAV